MSVHAGFKRQRDEEQEVGDEYHQTMEKIGTSSDGAAVTTRTTFDNSNYQQAPPPMTASTIQSTTYNLPYVTLSYEKKRYHYPSHEEYLTAKGKRIVEKMVPVEEKKGRSKKIATEELRRIVEDDPDAEPEEKRKPLLMGKLNAMCAW